MELANVKSIASKTVTITVASTITAYYALPMNGELISMVEALPSSALAWRD